MSERLVRQTLWRSPGVDAESIVGDASVRFVTKVGKGGVNRETLGAYWFVVLRNAMIDYIRYMKFKISIPIDALIESASHMPEIDTAIVLEECVREGDAEVLRMRMDGWKFREIAEITGRTEPAIKSQVMRAVSRLQTSFKP